MPPPLPHFAASSVACRSDAMGGKGGCRCPNSMTRNLEESGASSLSTIIMVVIRGVPPTWSASCTLPTTFDRTTSLVPARDPWWGSHTLFQGGGGVPGSLEEVGRRAPAASNQAHSLPLWGSSTHSSSLLFATGGFLGLSGVVFLSSVSLLLPCRFGWRGSGFLIASPPSSLVGLKAERLFWRGLLWKLGFCFWSGGRGGGKQARKMPGVEWLASKGKCLSWPHNPWHYQLSFQPGKWQPYSKKSGHPPCFHFF